MRTRGFRGPGYERWWLLHTVVRVERWQACRGCCSKLVSVFVAARQEQRHRERGCPGAGRAGQAVLRAQAVRPQEDGEHRLHRLAHPAEEGLHQLPLHLRGALCDTSHVATCKLFSGPSLTARGRLPSSKGIIHGSARESCTLPEEAFHTPEPQTDASGILRMVQCVSSCQERQCELNKVVTKGITSPLEVFYTGERP